MNSNDLYYCYLKVELQYIYTRVQYITKVSIAIDGI